MSTWLEDQSLVGESRGQVRYMLGMNLNVHKNIKQRKGKEKYYYIDKVFSLILSPERTKTQGKNLSKGAQWKYFPYQRAVSIIC